MGRGVIMDEELVCPHPFAVTPREYYKAPSMQGSQRTVLDLLLLNLSSVPFGLALVLSDS